MRRCEKERQIWTYDGELFLSATVTVTAECPATTRKFVPLTEWLTAGQNYIWLGSTSVMDGILGLIDHYGGYLWIEDAIYRGFPHIEPLCSLPLPARGTSGRKRIDA